jgi:hypothetical protein
MCNLIKLNQFGAFGVFLSDGSSVPLGAKHQALMALWRPQHRVSEQEHF